MNLQKTKTFKNKVVLFLKGLAMGGANKVPGVSGGIVAFVTGFYEELIFSFTRINAKAFALLFRGRFKSFLRYTNAKFLMILYAGSIFSYFSISRILDYFLKYNELYVWSLFFGLILGSIYYIAKGCKDFGTKNSIIMIFGAAIGLFISLMPPATENANLWFVFLCGVIGVSGMTIPGLSGSFILILLGNYVLLLVDSVNVLSQTLTDIFTGNFEFLHDAQRITYLKILGSFTAGSAFGLVVTSHVLSYILKRWHNIVTALILGFITGSLGNVWPWKLKIFKKMDSEFVLDSKGHQILENYQRFIPDYTISQTWIAVLFIVIGFLVLVAVEYYEKENKSVLV